MTAAAADLDIVRRDGQVINYKVEAAKLIYNGSLVVLNGSGNAEPATDASSKTFIGVAAEQVDNSAGAAQALDVDVWVDGAYLMTGSGFAATDVGKPVYASDDNTITLRATYVVRVGTIVEYVSATQVWVRIEPQLRPSQSGEFREFVLEVAGTAPGALSLAALAAPFGGTDFYVRSVQHMQAFVTATGASAGRKITATNYTVGGGAITLVTNEAANTLIIAFIGQLI